MSTVRLVYPIVPGESIGPFKLGMLRAEVRARAIGDVAHATAGWESIGDDAEMDHFPPCARQRVLR